MSLYLLFAEYLSSNVISYYFCDERSVFHPMEGAKGSVDWAIIFPTRVIVSDGSKHVSLLNSRWVSLRGMLRSWARKHVSWWMLAMLAERSGRPILISWRIQGEWSNSPVTRHEIVLGPCLHPYDRSNNMKKLFIKACTKTGPSQKYVVNHSRTPRFLS